MNAGDNDGIEENFYT
uniref:Uncharacterized protein n=1 Tax=Arundo donax TaxID=35708 RepID=A0A0A9CB24_ARUDO